MKRVFIPKNLDIDGLLHEHADLLAEMNLKNNPVTKDKIALMCHHLKLCMASHRDLFEDYFEGYVSERPFVGLSAKILQERVNDYNRILVFMVHAGVLIINHSYIAGGGKCKRYMFTDKYWGQATAFHMVRSHCLFKKLKKKAYVKTKGNHFLEKFWKSEMLSIDVKGAME